MAFDDITILVVEDEKTIVKGIKTLLSKMGFRRFIEAENGSVAWEILQKEKVDFIICDWYMPEMTGIELLMVLRKDERFKDIPFLMVSGSAKKENILEAVGAKVDNFLVKPFATEIFEEKINKIFGTV